MLEIKNLSKSFGNTVVLKNFNLGIEEGKITCILGESGSGKTTLLNAISGLTEYDGTISQCKVSYIFQRHNLINNISVYENLRLVSNEKDKILNMLDVAELSAKVKAFPSELSGGELQRVAICRAFLHPANVLLCDEPFSSLDLRIKIKLMQLLVDLHRKNSMTTLFVTHSVEEAMMLADRIVVLKNGKIAEDVTMNGQPLRPYGENSWQKSLILSAFL